MIDEKPSRFNRFFFWYLKPRDHPQSDYNVIARYGKRRTHLMFCICDDDGILAIDQTLHHSDKQSFTSDFFLQLIDFEEFLFCSYSLLWQGHIVLPRSWAVERCVDSGMSLSRDIFVNVDFFSWKLPFSLLVAHV